MEDTTALASIQSLMRGNAAKQAMEGIAMPAAVRSCRRDGRRLARFRAGKSRPVNISANSWTDAGRFEASACRHARIARRHGSGIPGGISGAWDDTRTSADAIEVRAGKGREPVS